MFIQYTFGEEPQGIIQSVVPAAHHAGGVGASPVILRAQNPAQESRLHHLDGRIGCQGLVETQLVPRLLLIKPLHPPAELGSDLFAGVNRESALGLVAGPVFR